MSFRSLLLCWSIVACFAAGAAAAEGPAPIALAAQPDIGPQLAAFPRLAAPDGPQMQRINQQLASADARARQAAQECRGQAADAGADPKEAGGWQRSVSVAMRGPRYLALVASDEWYCGGPYPSNESFALAYDVQTGAPLNWERLLPKSLGVTASLDTAGDGTRLGVVASPKLKALYMKAAKLDPDCVQALRDTDLQFLLWPDARREGVAVEPSNLPHVIAACGEDVVIPLPALRQLGVEPALLEAIAAAHQAKLYDPTP
jgi:hypothetical protein